MKASGTFWLGALFACATGCSALAHAAAAAPDVSAAASESRQVLVMLRLAAPHYRPDANYAGGYDARHGSGARQRVAEELAGRHGLRIVGEWPMPSLGVDCFVMEAAGREAPDRIAELLAADERVESAQPVNRFETLGHDDPLYALQPGARQWRLDELHRVTTGRNALIAEIDTGVQLDHPDLKGAIALARNFVDGSDYAAERHGTAVAGIIAARADNGLGIAGVAPQATLLALRACWQNSSTGAGASCNSFTLAKALQFALSRNVQIVNLSVGGPRDRLLERLLDAALEMGITVVGAADEHNPAAFPGSHPGVLRVAADTLGAQVPGTLLAPGQDIPTTLPGSRWDFVSGSSYAAAHVTGMVALLGELEPGIRPQQVAAALRGPALTVAPRGATLVDACAVIARAAKTGVCIRAREAITAYNPW